MRKDFNGRYAVVGIVFVVIILVLSVRIFDLQFTNGEKYLQKETEFSRRDIRLTGPRGKILDRNGLPLAYNKTSYSVQFVRDPQHNNEDGRKAYTQGFLQAIRIIEGNGGKFLSTFAIHKMDDGTYDFYWPGIDREESPQAFQDRIDKWKNENCIGTKINKKSTPEEIFNQCRLYYFIPEDASYDEAYKVLSAWQEARAVWYQSFLPVTLAQDVDMKTVAMIERQAIDLPGMKISMSTSRVYPNKSMAAHIIGYMGRMLDERQIVEMGKLGYRRDDLVGVSGIEASQEAALSGNTFERSGQQVVEVDYIGKLVRVIESDNRSPQPGNNVVLTIDSKLQKRLEEALAENIAQIRSAQETFYNDPENKETIDNYLLDRTNQSLQYAEVGAAVVMDVQTGEVLAMASYPSFDLNIFRGGLGITQKEFEAIKNDKRNPLFNKAISSRGTPGSVFKMATGLAGLMEGKLLLEEQIDDGGHYNKHVKDKENDLGPKCWTNYPSQHADQTIIDALKNSCNFFFFEVADRLGTDRLKTWAGRLGLTDKTGIELPNEAAGQIGCQEALYSKGHMSGVAALVRKQIAKLMRDTCEKAGLKYDSEKYTEVAIEMMDLVNSGLTELGPDIRTILKNDLKLSTEDIVKDNLFGNISMSLSEITWNPNMTIEAGIGQSVTLLTPIAMARYVSALVNGGNVFEARLVRSILPPNGAPKETQPKLVRNLAVPEEYLQAIKKGMKEVVSQEEGGTAGDYFEDFKYKNTEEQTYIGGKTGTAEVSRTIELENNSWFVAFAPYDKPEIAVVVYIPSGWKGALSSYTVKEIVEYYLDMKYLQKEQEVLPEINTLVK